MRYLIFTILIILTYSCERDSQGECFKGYGVTTEKIQELTPFVRVNLHGLFNVYLIQDTIDQVVIKTGNQLIEDIEFKMEDEVLFIYEHTRCKWIREYEKVSLYIHFTGLNFVRLWEPCTVIAPDTISGNFFRIYSFAKTFEGDVIINTDHFQFGVNFTCTGTMKISGKTDQFTLMNRGVHHVFADDLVSRFSDLTNNADGDVYAGRPDSLTANIWHKGNIYYRGDPKILSLEMTSSGKLVRLDD